LEDKRKRMLEIFYESKSFFNLKELEKIAPKEKGIVQQSVKDVIQLLVDDGYVDTDKIGTSIYYWALPSKATQIRKKRIAESESKVQGVSMKKGEIQKAIAQAEKFRQSDDPQQSQQLQRQISELEERQIHLMHKIDDYKDFDPDMIAKEKKDIQISKDAANRWTDNIFSTRSWLSKKFGMEESAVNTHFKIREDLDYLD